MPPTGPNSGGPEPSRRRSQRVILTLPVIVSSEGVTNGPAFQEETHTLVVNLHGALIVLEARVTKGQRLRLKNRATQAEQICRVASLGPVADGKGQVGVEFLQPSPDFWQISFPPEDWAIPEPSSVNPDNS